MGWVGLGHSDSRIPSACPSGLRQTGPRVELEEGKLHDVRLCPFADVFHGHFELDRGTRLGAGGCAIVLFQYDGTHQV